MPQDYTSIRLASAHPACLFSALILPGITKPFMRWDSIPDDVVVSNSFPTQRSCR